MLLVGGVEQITQVCGCAVGTDRLDRGAAKGSIEPAIVIIFTDRGAHDQSVVVKIPERADALVFLVCQDCFQTG